MSDTSGAKEYFEKLKIAEKFCDGDTVLAKKLLTGEYQDTGIIKARFNDADKDIFGLIIVFINRITFSLLSHLCLVTPSMSVNLVKPFDEWYSFYSRMIKEKESGVFDAERTILLRDALREKLDKRQVNSLFNMIEDNEIQLLTEIFTVITSEALSIPEISLVLDYEYTTSMILNEKLGLRP